MGRQYVIKYYLESMCSICKNFNDEWFINIISLKDKKSYFITQNDSIKSWLSSLFGVSFHGFVAIADRLWLRKEIIKHASQ